MNCGCHPRSSGSRESVTRQDFLKTAALATAAAFVPRSLRGQATPATAGELPVVDGRGAPTHPLIDIHAHQAPDSLPRTSGVRAMHRRTEAEFLDHQKAVNAVGSVILGGNDYDYGFIRDNPAKYMRFASGGMTGESREKTVERALKNGAKGIGEHRWEGDVPFTRAILDMARDYGVPVLFHLEEALYPAAVYADFYKTIEKYPTVKFIGHAADWWGGIDKNYRKGLFLRTRVTPGGLTDEWLSRYPNLYGDLSANSGNVALMRDPEFAKDFITRHQDKLMFGSDCTCTHGGTPTCWSGIKLVALNFLQLDAEVQQKIYLGNASKLLGISIGS